MAIKHSSVTKDQVLQGAFPQRQAQPRGFPFKTIIHCSGNSQQQEQGVQDCQPHAFTHVSSDQLNKTHVFGQVFSASVGSPKYPRWLLASRILRNLIIIKILRKNICLLLPQSATTVKSFPSPYPTPARRLMYFISMLFYIFQSNALNHSYFSCQQTHLVKCWFMFLATVSPRTVKKPVSTCQLRHEGIFLFAQKSLN